MACDHCLNTMISTVTPPTQRYVFGGDYEYCFCVGRSTVTVFPEDDRHDVATAFAVSSIRTCTAVGRA